MPHTGCAKFSARFGSDALRWINSPSRAESLPDAWHECHGDRERRTASASGTSSRRCEARRREPRDAGIGACARRSYRTRPHRSSHDGPCLEPPIRDGIGEGTLPPHRLIGGLPSRVVDPCGPARVPRSPGRPPGPSRHSARGCAMPDPTSEFFEGLAERGRIPALQRTTRTLRVDVDRDGRTDHWRLDIRRGDGCRRPAPRPTPTRTASSPRPAP